MPSQFTKIMEYIKTLDDEENPDYSYIKGLFKKAASVSKITLDNHFNW